MSARQVKNVSYTGVFIVMLASLAARALPTILTGLTPGLIFGGISKAISDSGTAGDGLQTISYYNPCQNDRWNVFGLV